MNDLEELYENNDSFRRFVDRMAKQHKLSKEIILELRITKEYADYIMEESIFAE